MNYNNVTDSLRKWCDDFMQLRHTAYRRTAQNPFAYSVAFDIRYRLGMLVDADFSSYEAYLSAVSEEITFFPEQTAEGMSSKIKQYYIHSIFNGLQSYLATLTTDCPAPGLSYCRILRGDEARQIAERFYSAWKYDTSYWYPLNGEPSDGRFFIPAKYFKPHISEFQSLTGIPQSHIYQYGESFSDRIHCAEVDFIDDFSGCEMTYSDKAFSWIIYFSHELTVSFAGTIVPGAMKILLREKEHWNRPEWND